MQPGISVSIIPISSIQSSAERLSHLLHVPPFVCLFVCLFLFLPSFQIRQTSRAFRSLRAKTTIRFFCCSVHLEWFTKQVRPRRSVPMYRTHRFCSPGVRLISGRAEKLIAAFKSSEESHRGIFPARSWHFSKIKSKAPVKRTNAKADVIILDLEDAVVKPMKATMRHKSTWKHCKAVVSKALQTRPFLSE